MRQRVVVDWLRENPSLLTPETKAVIEEREKEMEAQKLPPVAILARLAEEIGLPKEFRETPAQLRNAMETVTRVIWCVAELKSRGLEPGMKVREKGLEGRVGTIKRITNNFHITIREFRGNFHPLSLTRVHEP